MPVDLHELIGVPAVVLSHPRRDVVVALPEDELYWCVVEPDHYVGIRPHTPGTVPDGIEMQSRVEGTERLPVALASGKLRPGSCRQHAFVCPRQQFVNFLNREYTTVDGQPAERTLQRVLDRKLRMDHGRGAG